MATSEIVLPETKPETEWIDGRAVQKVSPTRSHARIQALLCRERLNWAGDRGQVATEWRFRLAPPGEVRRPLVPDVAFVANAAMLGVSDADLEVPWSSSSIPRRGRRGCTTTPVSGN